MRHHLLISIVGILIIAVALAGLLSELGSLSNPADAQQNESSIILENGTKMTFQTYNLPSNSAGLGANTSGTTSDGKTNGTSSNTTGTNAGASASLTSSTNNNPSDTTSSTSKTNSSSLNLTSSTSAINTSSSSTTGITNGNSSQTTSAAKTNTGLLFSPGNSTDRCYAPPPNVPLFEVSGAAHTRYLRESIGGQYEAGTWNQVDTKSFDYQALMMLPDAIPLIFSFPWNGLTLSLMSEPQEQPSSLYSDTITVKPYTTGQTILPGVIPTSLSIQNVNINGQFTPETAIFNSSGTVSSYTWQSNIYDFSSDQLNGDTTTNDPLYTQLPPDLPIRIKQLAQQITASANTPYE
jgi:hypothetical protein